MDRLSQVLWRERELLETLSYKLAVERLVLDSGRTDGLLLSATREVEGVRAALRATEVLRAVAADEAAEALGVAPDPSLTALADAAGDPWRGILLDHRDALVRLGAAVTRTPGVGAGQVPAVRPSRRRTLVLIAGGAGAGSGGRGADAVDDPSREA